MIACGGFTGTDTSADQDVLQEFDLSKGESRESTTAYGMSFLEQIRRTADKRYGPLFVSRIATQPLSDMTLPVAGGWSRPISSNSSRGKAMKNTTSGRECPFHSELSKTD